MIVWNDEKKQFLKDNVKGITENELLKKFNEHFNCNASMSSVLNQKNKLHLSSGIIGGQFQKGQVSHNKGKKWSDYVSKEGQLNSLKTTFKKGNVPNNRRELYEERIGKDGYLEIKVRDGECSTRKKNFVYKHRYLYEQYHGEIPKGYIVIFADGNIKNFEKDNLIAITRNEHARLNQNKLRFNDIEITKSAINIAKIMIKTSEIKNARKK